MQVLRADGQHPWGAGSSRGWTGPDSCRVLLNNRPDRLGAQCSCEASSLRGLLVTMGTRPGARGAPPPVLSARPPPLCRGGLRRCASAVTHRGLRVRSGKSPTDLMLSKISASDFGFELLGSRERSFAICSTSHRLSCRTQCAVPAEAARAKDAMNPPVVGGPSLRPRVQVVPS